MNEANEAVREAARDLTVEILDALGIKPEEMDSYFGEGSAGAAIELRLIRFAGAILEQGEAEATVQSGRQSVRGCRLVIAESEDL